MERELVPEAKSLASTKAAFRPLRVASHKTPAPVAPPPRMKRSYPFMLIPSS